MPVSTHPVRAGGIHLLPKSHPSAICHVKIKYRLPNWRFAVQVQ